ncbi:Solute carrier family 45 member [Nesidiocoris tenuis]|uniref:Solute carrier family 45 member n=1 Tax=Nesidiocoris tenuis TaxID=355587 RepID=A0ABN7B4L1_9HEMI|nr:Solute carrier family 45 member [Nesidiocoris tenuis]
MDGLNDSGEYFAGRIGNSTWRSFKHTKINLLSKSPPSQEGQVDRDDDYAHVFRDKTRAELVRLSATVMGIEFSYAAETAFVSPALLEIGVNHAQMTMAWALSPIVGFVLTPILGSLSDKCVLPYGRRRPFILLLSFGILLGMLLVPNGKQLGKLFGDVYPTVVKDDSDPDGNGTVTVSEGLPFGQPSNDSHSWGVFFTILGTVLLDFDADACQSPSRAYLLDIVLPEDQARGLSTFSLMAGLGGFMGYAMGGFNWDDTLLGKMFGGHVRTVFSLITVIFIACVTYTVTSFKEIPLLRLRETNEFYMTTKVGNTEGDAEGRSSYGAVGTTSVTQAQIPQEQVSSFGAEVITENVAETSAANGKKVVGQTVDELPAHEEQPSLREYLLSIVYMPDSMRILCLTNLFCWMAHVCYSLNFTDYVGESVFGGDPTAPEGSEKYKLYEDGVRFGCWGMSMYSLSCSIYSFIMEQLIQKFKAKKVYVGSLLLYGCGMFAMALMNNKFAVIVFSLNAGVMYSTLFTMPYLILANYHSKKIFNAEAEENFQRGLGTDVAVVSSMVFVAQFTLSLCLGSIVSVASTTTVVVYISSFFGFCASLAASRIMYLDL